MLLTCSGDNLQKSLCRGVENNPYKSKGDATKKSDLFTSSTAPKISSEGLLARWKSSSIKKNKIQQLEMKHTSNLNYDYPWHDVN